MRDHHDDMSKYYKRSCLPYYTFRKEYNAQMYVRINRRWSLQNRTNQLTNNKINVLLNNLRYESIINM